MSCNHLINLILKNNERFTMKYHTNGYMTFNDYVKMYMANWKRAALLLLAFWLGVTYLVMSPLRCTNNQEEMVEFQDRFRHMSAQFEALKQQHSSLINQIKKSPGLKDIDGLIAEGIQGPSAEYENLRRRVYTNTKELWYYISSELENLKTKEKSIDDKLQTIIDEVAARKRSLLSDQQTLPELDGYSEWRRNEAANVSDLIQRRLRYLQNPADCKEARKIVCNLNKGCGFGCQLHHIIYCLIFAYATERTLILNSRGWRYNPHGWDYVFHPLSDTCTSTFDDKIVLWPVSYDAKVVSLPFIDSIAQKPKFLPQAIPKDLAKRIVRFNGDPASWWIGQMLKYVLRLRDSKQRELNETIAKMNFKNPIVGVHIRRTDKVGTEAAFHHIQEYVKHVDDYYDQLELTTKVDVRRVYLATDDPNVVVDAREKFPQYEWVGDAGIARTAATHRRYTAASLSGLLVDLTLLHRADHLVCTFSSQVGRTAYEMMQSNRVDASNSFFSLDDIYYYGGQIAHDRVAVMKHKPKNKKEVTMEVDDHIGIAGNHWNGYGRGTNRRTNQNGLVPWYKTADHLVLYPFPEYKQVPLYTDTRQNDL